jgi:chromosome segregation ATPase
LGTTCDSLRGDLEQARNDTISLQNEHRLDRQVFNEKIQRHSDDAIQSKSKADDLERRCASLESELNMVRTRLDEESNGRERYTGESRELRGQVMRLETELNRVESLKAADKDSDAVKINSLERQLISIQEANKMTESSVVSLTTEIESIRRTLVRALDDVCSKYSHQCQPIADFVNSRTSRSFRPTTSPSKSLSLSQQPQVDGVRGAVREMSTLLHALASTSVAQHVAEQEELRTVQSRTSSVETELRRAQELLTTARRQHEGALKTTSSELASERERSKQLDLLVRQLRENATRSGQTTNDLTARIAELESQIIHEKQEIASLRAQLTASKDDCNYSREECDNLSKLLREANEKCNLLQRELDNCQLEMENLEETGKIVMISFLMRMRKQ